MDSRFRGNDRRKVCFNSFTEMPVKAAFMRRPGHTLPRGKREAVPGKATKKCRVDQAKRIHRSSAGANPARRISFPLNFASTSQDHFPLTPVPTQSHVGVNCGSVKRMKQVAQLLNDMLACGVIQNYALFGAMAQMRYTEAVATLDADVLVAVPSADKMDVFTGIYGFCKERGFETEGEAIRVGSWPV